MFSFHSKLNVIFYENDINIVYTLLFESAKGELVSTNLKHFFDNIFEIRSN